MSTAGAYALINENIYRKPDAFHTAPVPKAMNLMFHLVIILSLLPLVVQSQIITQDAFMWRKDCNAECRKADMERVLAKRPACTFNDDPIIIGSLTYSILKCWQNLASTVAAPRTKLPEPLERGRFVSAPYAQLEFDDDFQVNSTVTPTPTSTASPTVTPAITPTPTFTPVTITTPTTTATPNPTTSTSAIPSPTASTTPEEEDHCIEPQFRNVPWGIDEVDGNPDDGARSCECSNYGAGVHVVVMDTGCKPINGGLCSSLREEGACRDWHGHGSGVIQFIADPKYGVAPNADVSCWSMRFHYEDYLRGIQWAIDNGARVINMSFSWKMQHWSDEQRLKVESILNPAVEELANVYGIYVVNTPGNTQTGQKSCNSCFNAPASAQAEKLFTIQSHDARGNIARSSCYGTCTDLSAPGAYVPALNKYGRERSYSGTSYAAPHVTGAIARLLSDNMDVSKSILTSLGKEIVDNSGLRLKTLAVPCKELNDAAL